MRFMVLGPARSGTTAIRTALNRHPSVTCHGEILAPTRILGLAAGAELPNTSPSELLRLRNNSTIDFINRALANPTPLSGFKAIYHQLLQPDMAELLCYLRSDKRLAIVFTWRRNLVERFLSEKKLRVRYMRRDSAEREVELTIGVEEMLQDCRNQIAVRALMQELFAGHPSISFIHEEMLGRPDLRELNTLLGLSAPLIRLPAQSVDYRNDIKVTILNEPEICAAYDACSREFELD